MKKINLGPQTLLFPMPATLIGSQVDERVNFMTAAWCAIASYKPPSVAVAIRKERYTLKGVKEKGAFSVNVPSSSMVKIQIIVVCTPGKPKTNPKSLKSSMVSLN